MGVMNDLKDDPALDRVINKGELFFSKTGVGFVYISHGKEARMSQHARTALHKLIWGARRRPVRAPPESCRIAGTASRRAIILISLLDNRNRTQKWDESPCTLR